MNRNAKGIIYDTTGMPYQQHFHDSKKPKVYLSGGYGCGKTYSLSMKMFQLMGYNMGLAGGLLCPTMKMYKRDVKPTIEEICRNNRIRYKYNKSDGVWLFPDAQATIYVFHSEDDGDSIKGPNLAWFCINEVTLCTRNAFMAAIGRVRHKRAVLPQIAMSGTPESFNWCYEYFFEEPRDDTDIFYGDTRKNRHVGDFYVNNLLESYDELMLQQYLEGQFVNLNAKACAYAFNRKKHTDPNIKRIPDAPVYVALDFNVTPMAATLFNPVQINSSDARGRPVAKMRLQGFDEIKLDSANTYDLCDVLHNKLGDDLRKVTIFPDPAGRFRSTKSRNTTDFDILREYGGFKDIKYKSKISVRDCLNSLNSAFSKNGIVLNPKTCKNGIQDLEQCVFKKDTFEIDKTNIMRSHWLDGMKNMVEYLYPIRQRPAFRKERIR